MDENIRIREKIRERSVDFFSFVRFGRILVDPSSCVFVSYSRLQFSELPCSVQIQVTRSGQIADPSTFRQVGEISRPGRGVEIVVDELKLSAFIGFYSGRKQKAVLQMSGINPIFAFVPNLRIKNRMGRQIRLFDVALFRIGRG